MLISSRLTKRSMQGGSLILMTIGLSLAVFMQVLDSTIANVAIPTIAGDLGSSFSQGTWVITSFGVANAIAIPISGWLARIVGEVKLFIISIIFFTLTSWLCGISSSLEMLVIWRILQGISAGPIVPLAQSLLLNNYPTMKKGMALALLSMTVVVAPICGPILGGWISDNFHWGWIFFINIPFGFLVVFICYIVLKDRETKIFKQKVDSVGLVLLVLGVGALQLMLDQGRELDWFNSPKIIALTVISIICLIALVLWSITEKSPIIDMSLFSDRNFVIGSISVSLAFLIYLGTVILVPLLLQQVYGYTAGIAGLATAPVGIFPLILAPIIGKYGHKIDMRILVTISFFTYAASFYWRAVTFEPDMTFMNVVLPQLLQGLAVAFFFMPLTTITLSGITPDKMAMASSLFSFFRTLAGSIGAAITTFLWFNREAFHHERLSDRFNVLDPIINQNFDAYRAVGLKTEQIAAIINGEITKQGLIIAANEIFYLSAMCFVALSVIIWFAKPPFTPSMAKLPKKEK